MADEQEGTAEDQTPGWYTNDQGQWGYFDGSSFEMREPPAHVRVSAATSRPPSVLEQYGPLSIGMRAAGRAAKNLAGVPGAIGKAAYGLATSPVETLKGLGRGIQQEFPAIAGGVVGGLAGSAAGGVGALPGAAMGASLFKGGQMLGNRLAGEPLPGPAQVAEEMLVPAMETAAVPGAGRLAKSVGQQALRHMPGSSLERGTMAVERVREGTRDILPKTQPAEAKGLYASAKAGGERVLVAKTPLEGPLDAALDVLGVSGDFPAASRTVFTAQGAHQDLNALLGSKELTQLRRPRVERAFKELDAALQATAGQGPIATMQQLAGQHVTHPGAGAAEDFFKASQAHKEASTASEVLDFLERRGIADVASGEGSRLKLDQLVNRLRVPGEGEKFTWKMLEGTDPQAAAAIEDLIRSQGSLVGRQSVIGQNPMTRAMARFALPLMAGGAIGGHAGGFGGSGVGALAGYGGARALEEFMQTTTGRGLVRQAWEKSAAPFERPIGTRGARAGPAAIALEGGRRTDLDELKRRLGLR